MSAREVAATGLGFPEGPVVLGDGRLVFAEEYNGRVSIFDGSVTELAWTGGSPCGAVSTTAGDLLVCQNGPVQPWRGDPEVPGAILRVSLEGSWVTLATSVAGERFSRPNDLCFGPDGRLYFTDTGVWASLDGPGDEGRIFALAAGGGEVIARPGHVFNNGLAFTPDGELVWVETVTRRVMTQRGEFCTLPEGHQPDGLAVAEDGRLFIATLFSSGVTVVAPDGSIDGHIVLDSAACPTNCAFDGSTLWVTDPGDFEVPDGGRLWRIETDASGLALRTGDL